MYKKTNILLNSVKQEMKLFNLYFNEQIQSNISVLNYITKYLIKNKGKQIRPLLIFNIAKMLKKNILQKTYITAVLIELIHTATLIHDDVIDNTNIRRSNKSINKIWKNKTSILTGDYIFSKCILLAIEYKYYDILKIISKTIYNMSIGEIIQLEMSKNIFNNTEELYYKIIKYKTASLISACGEGSAISVGINKINVNKMKKLGKLIGIAFQIKDDIFDFIHNNTNSINDYIITLPVIHILNKINEKEKNTISKIVKKNNKKNIIILKKIVEKYNGIKYAMQKKIFFQKKALKILEKYPDTLLQKNLKNTIKYILKITY